MCVFVEPGALQAHRLFDDVADRTVAAVADGDVVGQLLYFDGGVCRTAFHTGQLHHRVVGDVIAHHQHLLGLEVVVGQVLVEDFDLVADMQEKLHAVEISESQLHRFGIAAGNDNHFVPFLEGVMQRIAVFDIRGAHLLAIGRHINHPVRQHPVKVKDEGAYFVQFLFIVLHCFPLWL